VPKSKTREKVAYTPPEQRVQKIKVESSAWVARFMVGFFVIGLAWIVSYYLNLQWISNLGAWNVVIGFAFIAAGFVTSTRWR
jgi:hypothetical protein